MRQVLRVLVIPALLALPAGSLAGPNAGGTLVVHDTGIAWSSDPVSLVSPSPASCASVDNYLPLNAVPNRTGWVWKVYAAFPTGSSPRLKAVAFGETFTVPGVIVFTGGLPNPATDFEVEQDGWPSTVGGAARISFGVTKTGR